MAALEDFENTLKEVVNAKRLSASKMNKLTEIAVKSLEDDTKLVAILYRTHKSLPSSAKVSSLYAFDALARAARGLVNKRAITGDLNPEKGNAATFLLKIEGILDGLFQDMGAINNSEAKVIRPPHRGNIVAAYELYFHLAALRATVKPGHRQGSHVWARLATSAFCHLMMPKISTFPYLAREGLVTEYIILTPILPQEKTKKVLDIWVKSNTFPSPVLTRLRDILSDVQKENAVNPTPSIDPRVTTEVSTTIATPQSAAQTTSAPVPDAQATLLALLGQAAQITGQSQPTDANNQTSPNTEPVAPQLGQAQLALLQQLALTAKLRNGPLTPGGQSAPAPPQTGPSITLVRASEPSHTYLRHPSAGLISNHRFDSQGDPRYGHSGYPDRPRHEPHDDRHPPRGGSRGGYRGRGHNRWDDRNNHDRFKHRDRNCDPPSRPRRSRSRSPRRFEEQRNVRSHSPPYRPSNGKDLHDQSKLATPGAPESGKDEFGRDIRPSSVSPPRSMLTEDTPPQVPTDPSVVPAPAAAPDYHIPVSDQLPSVAASTSAQSTETHTPSSATSQQQLGLDQFDITTFDATTPSSWEALGNMWQTTYGCTPSQEELMHFVIAGSMVAGATNGAFGGVQGGQWQEVGWDGQGPMGSGGWRGGRGKGSYMNGKRGGNFGHGNHRDGGGYSDAMQQYSEPTYAIVLNGDDDQSTGEMEASSQSISEDHPNFQDLTSNATQRGGGGGRMQRVGDKWIFVRP
ncbi:hypothetical protein BS17DRAFT_766664 [Gyrodon lividus]|nr:hypothetical protein BS17DRAFT_766664 [Gyrodon lividus]